MNVSEPALVATTLFLMVFFGFWFVVALFGEPWIERLREKYHR